MPTIETVSFRNQMIETMQNFLAKQRPGAEQYADFLGELTVSLSGHREEGVSLYPVVFVCDNMQRMTEALRGGKPLLIGDALINRETVRRVLKQCAPLSERRQWAVFIELGERARFGVFQIERSVLEPTILSALRNMRRDDLFLIGLTQLGDNVVEVQGANGQGLQFYLSGARVDARLPGEVVQAFMKAVSQDAEPELVGPLQTFYARIAADLTRGLHGSLLAVIPKHDQHMEIFTDAILLPAPVEIPETIRALQTRAGAVEASTLYAQASLIRGMLSCDGITLFRSDGALLGYNAFIQLNTLHRPGLGGARRRAYDSLAGYVGQGISLAVYRSQDGTLDYTCLEDRNG